MTGVQTCALPIFTVPGKIGIFKYRYFFCGFKNKSEMAGGLVDVLIKSFRTGPGVIGVIDSYTRIGVSILL